MKRKLTFSERLARQSLSREKHSIEKTSIEKVSEVKAHEQKARYTQFKQQHNELKNMLKMFQSIKIPQDDKSPELISVSPPRNRLTERKYINKNVINKPKQLARQAVKQNLWQPQSAKLVREEYKMNTSLVLPRTSPTIPHHKELTSAKINQLTKKGIPNIGNTCYINALVQCLFHLPHFNDYFADQKYIVERNGKIKDVVQLYKSLYINAMRSNSNADLSTLPLKKSVSKICSLFIDWQQEDAHQFMKQLLNSIHQNLNRVKVKPKYKYMYKEIEDQPVQKKAAAFWGYEKQRDDSYIYDSLCGQLYNNIRCINCNHESQCFQNFLDLSIPMVTNVNSLEGLLNNFFQPEKLSDFYRCDKCDKSSKKSIKTVQLWRVPKFLIIHLKRSQFGKKNTDAITIPQSLTLKSFMTLSNDKTARFCQYSLCGIIMHQGVLEGGHYWCNVKQNGKWFSIDDEKVKEVDSNNFKQQITKKGSSNAYILFYSSLYC